MFEIKQYRKRPVVIQAIQFQDTVECLTKLSWFMAAQDLEVSYENPDKPIIKISTLEGVMTANVGDWIIKGVNGEFYPCKPDIFEKTYEEV